MTDSTTPRQGYFQQYLARMAPTPLPPPPLPFPASSGKPILRLTGPTIGRRAVGNKGKVISRKSLVDVFKQYGMKLCDGSKLHVVAKGVTYLGIIPPTLGVHITALYLSQNDLNRLDGIEQFKNVRLLSVAANRLVRFSDIDRLKSLTQLRHLNLAGNPLCDHPNYRFRVIDALPQLAVLDTIEISKQERDLAPLLASQDRALREMVMKNHMEIQTLQRIALWIPVLGQLHCVVLRDAITGRFDQLPTPLSDSGFNIERFLRLSQNEEPIVSRESDLLEAQMMAIVARTRMKLTEETPQTKAKEMLFLLAKASAIRRGRLNELPPAVQREHCVWEDAYALVLQLQQQTIANLRSECDRHRQASLHSMRELMVINPSHRRALNICDEKASRCQLNRLKSQQSRPAHHDAATDTGEQRLMTSASDDGEYEVQLSTITGKGERMPEKSKSSMRQNPLSLRRVLRAGQFGNKTLKEAIDSFSLRQPLVSKQAPVAHRAQKSVSQHACASRILEVSGAIKHLNMSPETVSQTSPRSRPTYTGIDIKSSRDMDLFVGMKTETVCSGDTVYAPSVGDFSSLDDDCDADSITKTSITIASRAQHFRSQDRLLQQQAIQSHDLKTVFEEDSVSDLVENAQEETNRLRKLHDTTIPRPRFLNERQHELEAREEKYITALMESEQRELDLRQQISTMNDELARFEKLLSDNQKERHRIKEEINERASAVARPTLLRRFFVKWIRYYHWSQQIRRIQGKRAFVIQHGMFWCWRRQVWAVQQLRRIQRRQQSRLLQSHLTEWANLTRISVIALHTHALRQSQLLKRVVTEWREQTHVKKLMRCMVADRSQVVCQQHVAAAFSAWRRVTTQMTQYRKLHEYYAREVVNTVKQTAMRRWRMYLLMIARPQRTKVAMFVVTLNQRIKKAFVMSWRACTRAQKLRFSLLCRKVYLAWRSAVLLHIAERERAKSFHSELLKINFLNWRQVAADRATSRRSLSLATRHVNHRRLRKLWMYWKLYSIARKRYMQGATKARKHYYIKLLRRTWRIWEKVTRDNLVSMKSKKRGELHYHFNALREGVRKLSLEKRRQIFVSHAIKRRLLHTVRQAFTAWTRNTKCRRRCKIFYRILTGSRKRMLMSYVWARWKRERLFRVQDRLIESRQYTKKRDEEKKEVEREFSQLNKRSVLLTDQVRQLSAQVGDQTKEIRTYQEELHQRELVIDELEKQLDQTMQRLLQSEDKRKEDIKNVQQQAMEQQHRVLELEKDNAQLVKINNELQKHAESLSGSLDEATKEITTIKIQLVDSQGVVDKLRRSYEEREQSLQNAIESLEKRLEEEHSEREETVRRLQEYESRIASTCAEISDHEQAHEQECIRLRAENTRLDILQKEAAVRSAELERLLSEKNEQIIALTIRLKNVQSNDENRTQIRRHHVESANEHFQDATRTSKVPTHDKEITDKDETKKLRSEETSASEMTDSDSAVTCVPVKNVHHCVLVATEDHCTRNHLDAPAIAESINSIPAIPSEEERRIDERTSQIHADIQLLQDRITKRLQQVPCVPSTDQFSRTQYQATKFSMESDGCSVSTLSESEHEGDRKAIRRSNPPVTRTRLQTTSMRASVTRKKLTASATTDRENSSQCANQSALRGTSTQPILKSRVEPYPPRKSETIKTKKPSSGRTAIKGKQRVVTRS